jgi:hypothetical protein
MDKDSIAAALDRVIDRAASVITAMGIMTREEMDEILAKLADIDVSYISNSDLR